MSEAAPGVDVGEVEYQDESRPEVRNGWHIEDMESADWALERLGEMETEVCENDDLFSSAITRLEMRRDQMNAQAKRGMDFFRNRLVEFGANNRELLLKGGKLKTRKFPHGQIAYRKSGGGLAVEDQAALLAWANQQAVELDLVRHKEEPALDPIWAYAAEQKIVPAGCVKVPETEEIKVKAVTGGTNGKH